MNSKKKNIKRTAKAPVEELVHEIGSSQLFETTEESQSYHYTSENLEERSATSAERAFSRTSLLLLDHRKFMAARTIQTALRGWLVRHMIVKCRCAAIIIQREWRRFRAMRYYYCRLEATLQQRIIAHYYRSAQIIQAFWRGWWVRENVHDQYRLMRMQMRAAQDLLQCIAFKLHHLLRTHQIPGIYSLRNSNCLSKIEQLLTSLSFKKHNTRVRLARARLEAQLGQARKTFQDAAYSTKLPYAGPNFDNFCEPQCLKLYNEADADIKMHKILSLYERTASLVPPVKRHQNIKAIQLKTHPGTERKLFKPKSSVNFCTDVVNTMKRWNILNEQNLSIDASIFKKPRNIEKFLDDIESVYSMMQMRCFCKYKQDDIIQCNSVKN